MDLSFLKARKSKIAGKGIFTNIEIKKGETICFLEGELCSLDEMIKRVKQGKERASDPLGINDEEYIKLYTKI